MLPADASQNTFSSSFARQKARRVIGRVLLGQSGDPFWSWLPEPSVSCPRFLWTPICPTGGRYGEV